MSRFLVCTLLLCCNLVLLAADPTATSYSRKDCEGTSIPYPTDIKPRIYPDSLTPVSINHVGRHGARYPSSSRYVTGVKRQLMKADSLGTITPSGKSLLKLCRQIEAQVGKQWGALDSLGMAEERAIASRMFMTFNKVFNAPNPQIQAFSSYAPRCILSMDEFTHQLARLNNRVEISTRSGRTLSPLLRFFDTNAEYKAYIETDDWRQTYDNFVSQALNPDKIARNVMGERYPLEEGEALDIALDMYKVISGCSAMGMRVKDSRQWLSDAEYNALWACDNLKHYLTYSATTLSLEPSYMAAPLLENIISTLDSIVADDAKGKAVPAAILRFGHAETLMPLFALMHLPGCYYMTNYFDTVGLHWRDFYMVPMGANLQIILFKTAKGHYYVRTDLNEVPVPLVPGRPGLYTSWEVAKEYLTRCMPLFAM